MVATMEAHARNAARSYGTAKLTPCPAGGFPDPAIYPTMTAVEFGMISGTTAKHARELFHRGQLKGCQLGRSIRLNRLAAYQLLGIEPDEYAKEG